MRIHFTLLLSSLLLFGCGGGGGGGGSAASETGLRVLHAALDYGPLELHSTAAPGEVVATSDFSSSPIRSAVASGAQTLSVSIKGDSGSILWTGADTLDGDSRKSIVVAGGYQNVPVAVSEIDDKVPDMPSGKAAVRLVNGLARSGALSAEVVGGPVTTDVGVGNASQYIIVTAGPASILVKNGSATVGTASGALTEGFAYTVFIKGAKGYFSTTSLIRD